MAADGAEDASHLDIVRAIGRLEGSTQQNFTTLFNVQRVQNSKLDDLSTRLARLEARPRARLVARKRLTWKTGTAIAAAVVAILGGLSSAYDHAAEVLAAIDHALRLPPGK